jgi:hypothetical protein
MRILSNIKARVSHTIHQMFNDKNNYFPIELIYQIQNGNHIYMGIYSISDYKSQIYE